MPFCSHCGTELAGPSAACPKCGAAPASTPRALRTRRPAPPPFGLFRGLFDFNFNHFILLRLVKYAYIVGIILILVQATAIVLSLTSGDSGTMHSSVTGTEKTVGIALSPILALVEIFVLRVFLEAVVALVRIAENSSDLVEAFYDGA